jgi:hypothetical protein
MDTPSLVQAVIADAIQADHDRSYLVAANLYIRGALCALPRAQR